MPNFNESLSFVRECTDQGQLREFVRSASAQLVQAMVRVATGTYDSAVADRENDGAPCAEAFDFPGMTAADRAAFYLASSNFDGAEAGCPVDAFNTAAYYAFEQDAISAMESRIENEPETRTPARRPLGTPRPRGEDPTERATTAALNVEDGQ